MTKMRFFSLIVLLFLFLLASCSIPNQATPSRTPLKPTIQNTPTPEIWVIPSGTGTKYRAIHMGGNWGTNQDGGVKKLPKKYFEWLRKINVNWVGISVAIYVDDSMDSSVERKYSTDEVKFPTFTDEALTLLIRAFRQHGFKVFLTLAIEDTNSAIASHPVERWMLGDPDIYDEADILPEFWPWALNHPDHERFVAEFWKTYTDQAEHFANIAEQEGVGLYSLGTETDRLFRTRPSGVGPDDYGDEISHLVEQVTKIYSGLITYDQHYESLMHNDWYPSIELWKDAGFDAIGISAYFPLLDKAPDAVVSVVEFESRWDAIFKKYLAPLKDSYPDKPILFTEFGYTDAFESPFQPYAEEFVQRIKKDIDGNGLDDGQEMQANIYAALFNVMERYPGVLEGAFLWGNMMADDAKWKEFFGLSRGFDIRFKLSEAVVKERYEKWR